MISAPQRRHLHERVEQAALDPAGVVDADHHRRQQVLEYPGRREIICRTNFAQVGHHRLGRFRAIDSEAGEQRLCIGEQMIPDPGHRQV